MKSHRSDSRGRSHANPIEQALSGSMAGAERQAAVFNKGIRTFREESLRFATRRFEDNLRAFERMSGCRTLPDLLVAQQQWLADTARAYTEEWARYGELMTDALQEETEALDETVSEATSRTH
jgi:hypothetical protein